MHSDESLSLDCPCCSELVFANLSYYLLLSASSQAWPVPSWCLWLSFGSSGWGRTCAGSLVRSWMAQLALEPAVLVALAVCQAGRGHWQVPTQDNSHSVLLKPGCSSSVSGVQLMLSMLPPLAALLPFPCSFLDKACLSLRQTRKTRKGFYPQPARRFVLIPEVPAPICRAAISQLSPPLFSVGREARHCCKLWPAE